MDLDLELDPDRRGSPQLRPRPWRERLAGDRAHVLADRRSHSPSPSQSYLDWAISSRAAAMSPLSPGVAYGS